MTGPHGPKVVAIGGGHGLAATLTAVRRFASSITAVVSVADDGGSSGRLRRQLGIVPPGDIRKCLVALAEPGSLLAAAFEHRFEGEDLEGHAVGNLVIAGLTAVAGDVQIGLDEAGRLLGAAGRVVPATGEPVVLKAESDQGEIEGQTAVTRTRHIRRISLVPADPPARPEALAALAEADLVVIGPGSLFTSILAAVAVPGLGLALRQAPGRRVYVANLQAQAAETEGFDVADHVRALQAHQVEVDVVLCDTSAIELGEPGVPVVEAALGRTDGGPGHDPTRLAAALAGLVG
ncbi:MAG TPA: uridine diphosphate-N-acetylglucosamine-binding protein YvcK [Acidimicrobiales bacterium]|nr:uridine diphosphate-N-acetylglucosamine-binding protein YvcK [Acidimicrobiales bacterium]